MPACTRCGLGLPELSGAGTFARIAKRLELEGNLLCERCAGAEDHAEAIKAEAERARVAHERRLGRSGLPRELIGFRIVDLDDDVPETPRKAATAWSSGQVRGLLIAGAVGRGKTWLAGAAANEILRWRSVTWCSVARLILRMSASFSDEDRTQALRTLVGDDGLVLDDLEQTTRSDWARQHIYTAIDTRIVAGSPLLVTTKLSIDQIGHRLGEDIASRLEGYCEVVTISGPDRRRRIYRRRKQAKAEAERGF